jgi:hypothetical protein
MLEHHVREAVRRMWAGDPLGLSWVEQARGSTAGTPDVTIPLPRPWHDVPTELKLWRRTSKGLECKVRPAQRRWHTLQNRGGNRTAFIIGQERNGTLMLSAFAGHLVPMEDYPKGGPPVMFPIASKAALVALFCSDVFWSMQR